MKSIRTKRKTTRSEAGNPCQSPEEWRLCLEEPALGISQWQMPPPPPPPTPEAQLLVLRALFSEVLIFLLPWHC